LLDNYIFQVSYQLRASSTSRSTYQSMILKWESAVVMVSLGGY
jgi:hypothetical protein